MTKPPIILELLSWILYVEQIDFYSVEASVFESFFVLAAELMYSLYECGGITTSRCVWSLVRLGTPGFSRLLLWWSLIDHPSQYSHP